MGQDRTLASVTRIRRAERAERLVRLDLHPNRAAGWRGVAYAVATAAEGAGPGNAYDPSGRQSVDPATGDAPHGEPAAGAEVPHPQRGVIPPDDAEDGTAEQRAFTAALERACETDA